MSVEKTVLREIWEWLIVIATAFILVLIINTTVFATTQVRQTSMQNTLEQGQHLIVEKLTYLIGKPQREDIIVFVENQYPRNYIDRVKIFLKDVSEVFTPIELKTNVRLVKRVIGVPGDEVDLRDGKVYVNGEQLDEPYANGETFPRELQFPVRIPDNKYLVLGDNREVSKDSRTFGLIDRSQIEGKAVFRFWPPDKFGMVK